MNFEHFYTFTKNYIYIIGTRTRTEDCTSTEVTAIPGTISIQYEALAPYDFIET